MALPSVRNNLLGTFSAGFNDVATSLTVTDGSDLPAGDFYLSVYDNAYMSPRLDPSFERIYVTTRTGNTLDPVTRGTGGTTAAAHNTSGRTYAYFMSIGREEYEAVGTDIAAIVTSVDIQEGGASVVAAADTVNFDTNHFEITDETGGVAGATLRPHAVCQYVPHPMSGVWAAQSYGAYTNLNVYVLPVKLVAQANVISLTFNLSVIGSGGSDMFCVGFYNYAKNKVLDGKWQNINSGIGNKTGTFTATDLPYDGQYFLAWSTSKTGTPQIWGISLDTGNQGLLNSGGASIYCGVAANQAGAAVLDTATLPSALGNISSTGIGVGWPVVVIAS